VSVPACSWISVTVTPTAIKRSRVAARSAQRKQIDGERPSVFSEHRLHRGDLQIPLRQKALEDVVLALRLAQATHAFRLDARKLRPPDVVGILAHAVLPTDIRNRPFASRRLLKDTHVLGLAGLRLLHGSPTPRRKEEDSSCAVFIFGGQPRIVDDN
jgi:hypothetical protein